MSFELPPEEPSDPPLPGQEVLWGEGPAQPVPASSRHHVRRTVAIVAIVVLGLGALGGGLVAAKQQHDEKVRKERIAAEKRAADAYVVAMRPIANRVFDAVQPIQNAIDAFSNPSPGLFDALVDVVTKGGGEAELKAARTAFLAQHPPVTHKAAAVDLTAALTRLVNAVHRYDQALRAPRSRGGECEGCDAEDEVQAAETEWGNALLVLHADKALSAPGPVGGVHDGPVPRTRGGFILAADLVCARASNRVGALPDLSDVETVRRIFPRQADVLRDAVAALNKVKLPARSAALAHRIDVQLKGVSALANTLDELSTALKRRDLERYRRAAGVLDDELEVFKRLSATYKSTGASVCGVFFAVPAEKASKPSLRA